MKKGTRGDPFKNLKDARRESFIGEMLMETKSLPSRLWIVLLTNKGVHFVYFRDIPMFEIITLSFVWLAILLGAILNDFNKLAIFTCILLVISMVYFLDRNKIRGRWERFSHVTLRKKLFSDSRNIHLRKDEISKLFGDETNVVIYTDKIIYRFQYYINEHGGYYINGLNPFQNEGAKISSKRSELSVEKVFSKEIWGPLREESLITL